MARGEIPPTLPFVHREAVKALNAVYPTQDAALDGDRARRSGRSIATSYSAALRVTAQDVEKAVAGAQRIYRRNVFPEMHVDSARIRTTSATWIRRAASAATTTATRPTDGQPDRPGLRDLPRHRIGTARSRP